MAKRQWSRSLQGAVAIAAESANDNSMAFRAAPLLGAHTSSVMVLHRTHGRRVPPIFREVCGVRLVRTQSMGGQKTKQSSPTKQSASCSETPPTVPRLAAPLFRLA
jgi:hypothetical protein